MTIEQFNILNNHIGYGNPEAEIVFMGLEEGCQENNLEDNFSFISTGGGAMLDFLVDGSLPGIDIILTQKDN